MAPKKGFNSSDKEEIKKIIMEEINEGRMKEIDDLKKIKWKQELWVKIRPGLNQGRRLYGSKKNKPFRTNLKKFIKTKEVTGKFVFYFGSH
jgi:hypothetical protein